jgi:[acyl-carrier-protein] S-malonyltransferase
MADGFVFSGQGSQYVGMGVSLDHPAARKTFEGADEALGEDLSTLIREGPIETLTLTENAQPAILAHSVALLRVLAEVHPQIQPVVAAGHSLGEYSALVAAGSLEFQDAVRLVRLRGRAMQAAVPAGVGGMAAIMGLDVPTLEGLCRDVAQGEVLEVAGHNSRVQVVVAGHLGALERLMNAAREAGARQCAALQVSAPFHCSLLAPAGEVLSEALEDVDIKPPRFPVFQNATAAASDDPVAIRRALVDQVSCPVRWVECVEAMQAAGVQRFLEFGPGRTLSGLIKRVDRSLETLALDRTGTMEAL